VNTIRLTLYRRIGIAIAIVVLFPVCVSIDRGKNQKRLSFDGEYSYAGDQLHGCDGPPTHVQRQHLTGGRVSFEYSHQDGLNSEAEASLVHGELAGNPDFTPVQKSYWMGNIGGSAGYDARYVGFDLGLGIYLSENGQSLFLPRGTIRFGLLTLTWFEAGFGPLNSPFDSRLVFGGIGGKTSILSYHIGVAGLNHPMLDLAKRDLFLGSMDQNADFSLYGKLNLQLGRGFGVNFGAAAARTYGFLLGITCDLD